MQSILVFYSSSSDKKAGCGKDEYKTDKDNFTELDKIKDWRKILSNFHYEPFKWNNTEWSCIEEAFQASKFGPENYELFKKDMRLISKNIETDAGQSARKMRKWKILNKEQLCEWNKSKKNIMGSISFEKFLCSEIGKKVLINTGNAILMHSLPRTSTKIRFDHLEEIRNILQGLKDGY